jgi:hypothetical protein
MSVRRKLAALLVTILGTVAWFASAAPAQAGGPTTVLLANPELSRVKALYTTDKAYERLAAGVGAFGRDIGSTSKPHSIPDEVRGEIRLTWLAHEMMIWRLDRVYFTTHDGIWVETTLADRQGYMFKLPARWHRAASQKVLMASLTAAGMIAGSNPSRRRIWQV